MATRSEYDSPVIDTAGNALENVEVTVEDSDTAILSTLYAGKTGSGQISNPYTTTSTGNLQFWANPGSYDLTFHDNEVPARFTDRTITWEAVSGGLAGIAWAQIDVSQIPPDSFTSIHILDGTIVDVDVSPTAAIQGGKLDTTDGRLRQTTGMIAQSSDFTYNYPASFDTGFTDLSNASATITPDVPAYLIGTLSALHEINAFSGAYAYAGEVSARILVDGNDQGGQSLVDHASSEYPAIPNFHSQLSQVYRIALTATEHTVKIQGRLVTATGGYTRISTARFLWQLVAQS